ncbi:MAG: hypothetical protein KDA69_04220 [Planctomycetaceae bacterium]|nr:hypothetical protein [Planctomycetaceae bacterium]
MRSRPLSTSLFLVALVLCSAVVQADDFDEWRAGLVATYRNGTASVQRVEHTVFAKAANTALLEGISSNGGEIEWDGYLLVRDADLQFHFWLQGELEVRIGDQLIYQGQRAEAGWVSSEQVTVDYGFQRINVKLKCVDANAELKVYWSADSYPLEPIPSHQLFHATESVINNEQLVWDLGRQHFESHRCDRCHAINPETESVPAPALWGVTLGMNPVWLKQKLLNLHAESKTSNMPNFGFTEEEADAIAAYLIGLESPSQLVSVPEVKQDKKNPIPSGEVLLGTVGCRGCHRENVTPLTNPFAAPDLSHIGAKRSPEWLATWLFRPERLNPQHEMPVFKLSASERGQLVDALSKLGRTDDVTFIGESPDRPSNALVDQGRDLVKKFRCANCHKIPAIEADRRGMSTLRDVKNFTGGCLSDAPNKELGQPMFPSVIRPTLRVYLQSLQKTEFEPVAETELGRRVMESRNCLGCHARERFPGNAHVARTIAEQLEGFDGHPGELIPPPLTAIGDKLLDSALQKSVAGEQEGLRQNWLRVQMPKFQHASEDRQRLLSYLVAHDRIPDNAPDPRVTKGMETLAKLDGVSEQQTENLTHGRRLIGAGGLNCIACHQVGSYTPRNVAPGARGSDLKQASGRLRPEFFFRWTRNPLRVVPGMEMPAYQRPVPKLFDEDITQQLAVVWNVLQDPKFEAPTNPTQVEQLLVVENPGQPRIVRDVFELPQPEGGYVARSFAVGFSNGHAALFDLDTLSVRQWTYGDFASQKTAGKSWFWELAGVSVPEFSTANTEWQLTTPNADLQLSPESIKSTRLLSYQVEPHTGHVLLAYEVEIALDSDQTILFSFDEVWSQLNSDAAANSQGWQRLIGVSNVPEGYSLKGTHGGKPLQSVAASPDSPVELFQIPYASRLSGYIPVAPPQIITQVEPESVTTLPGYIGERLPLPAEVMPTSLAWTAGGDLVFTSLKGHVFGWRTNEDGSSELLTIAEGLAAPFGVMCDGNDLLIAHKPELLRLTNVTSEGRLTGAAPDHEVVASGWGYNEDYHDWTTGAVRDSRGNIYIALGSDYAQSKRPQSQQRWRGVILRLDSNGQLYPVARELRYPVGIAFDADDNLYVTDQQGVQNTFNELNHIVDGHRYGVPGQEDLRNELSGFEGVPTGDLEEKDWPSVQIPHPWTRSVNGLFFLPKEGAFAEHPFAGHGIGCEYNGRFLVRMSTQEVDGVRQGAVYPFTRPATENTFLGPMCGGVAPDGDIYVGSIHDSGWLGGLNTGEIVRLKRSTEPLPNGIREVRLVPGGFKVEFVHPLGNADDVRFSISAYTRKWSGAYASEDSERHEPKVTERRLSNDGRVVTLSLDQIRPRFVYEFRITSEKPDAEMFPDFAAYTVRKLAP